MADVLLTHSNHLYSDPKQVAKMQPYPPLQTILAAAVLEVPAHMVGLEHRRVQGRQTTFALGLAAPPPAPLFLRWRASRRAVEESTKASSGAADIIPRWIR
jgi:hypothetical protein